jgi:hypothetical protein
MVGLVVAPARKAVGDGALLGIGPWGVAECAPGTALTNAGDAGPVAGRGAAAVLVCTATLAIVPATGVLTPDPVEAPRAD